MHDKHSFEALVERLGIPAPVGVTVRSDDELREAVARWPHYFARGVYSRGGVTLLTNTGPLAGRVRLEDVHPTPDAPWLVQEFVDGPMVCTYSTLHDGRVTGHCTYRAPRQYHHSTAVQLETVAGEETLEVVERLGAELGYTGEVGPNRLPEARQGPDHRHGDAGWRQVGAARHPRRRLARGVPGRGGAHRPAQVPPSRG